MKSTPLWSLHTLVFLKTTFQTYETNVFCSPKHYEALRIFIQRPRTNQALLNLYMYIQTLSSGRHGGTKKPVNSTLFCMPSDESLVRERKRHLYVVAQVTIRTSASIWFRPDWRHLILPQSVRAPSTLRSGRNQLPLKQFLSGRYGPIERLLSFLNERPISKTSKARNRLHGDNFFKKTRRNTDHKFFVQ